MSNIGVVVSAGARLVVTASNLAFVSSAFTLLARAVNAVAQKVFHSSELHDRFFDVLKQLPAHEWIPFLSVKQAAVVAIISLVASMWAIVRYSGRRGSFLDNIDNGFGRAPEIFKKLVFYTHPITVFELWQGSGPVSC